VSFTPSRIWHISTVLLESAGVDPYRVHYVRYEHGAADGAPVLTVEMYAVDEDGKFYIDTDLDEVATESKRFEWKEVSE
jgi:hypothetical protein